MTPGTTGPLILTVGVEDHGRHGTVPDGGYYDPSIIPYMFWQFFHKWSDLTPDQQTGIVVYLRSLKPKAQSGKFNFGGMMPGGGPPPGFDAGGATNDAGTSGSDASAE